MSFTARFLSLLSALLFMTGCLVSEDSKDLFTGRNSEACEGAQPYAFDGIAVRFNIPDNALDFRITRDGAPIFQTSDNSQDQYADTNLIPGQTYRYRCEAMVDRNRGFQQVGQELTVTLPATIPPNFDGLTNATLQGTDQAFLEWDLISDSILSHFKVYKVIDPASSNSEFPSSEELRINDLFAVSSYINNLGDDLTYSFRVSACNTSDICDDNNSIFSITTPDTGPPQTQGATDISIVNQQVVLTAPWSDQDGGLARRTIYRANVATGSPCPSDFASFTEVNSFFIVNQRDTPTRLAASGTLNEGSKYCYVVRDRDPAGNQETNFNVQEVTIGDLTVPEFLSQVSLVRDTNNVENNLVASWSAMANETENALQGAHEYLLYIDTVSSGQPSSNVCETGNLLQVIPASGYTTGQTIEINIGGLQSRSASRVCVKARDSSGNVSTQSPSAFATTGDVTAPNFSGIQSVTFNPSQGAVDVAFIVPVASDLKNYIISGTRRRGSVTTDLAPVFEVLPPQSPGSTAQTTIPLSTLNAEDGDVLTLKVDACDNANPDYNSVDNCSNTAASQTLIIPDATPPQGFQGVTVAIPGPNHRSVELSWPAPTDWDDYAGFRAYYVNESGDLTALNSSDCVCVQNDCNANPKTSCLVDREDSGPSLVPSKNIEFYVSAYDAQSNETRSYNPHSGPGARTRFSRVQDLVAPIFNATVDLAINSGIDVTFDQAVDEQDSSLELTYEIYRKVGSTFTCPLTPFDSAGGCDGLSPYATALASDLADAPGDKKQYKDTVIEDGLQYFYQICAIDFANNRQCQTGAIANITVEDTTAPEITNAESLKRFDGNTSWTVQFQVSDNIAEPSQIQLNVYKGATGYPDPQNLPGSPDILNQDISRDAAGNASFTDSGTANIPTTYYLIEARDLNGNRSYAQLRDMRPAPVVTSVVWPDPVDDDGNPITGINIGGSANYYFRILGENLDSIVEINEDDTPASQQDQRHCFTTRIISQTESEIRCSFLSQIYNDRDYTLYMKDDVGRSITFVSGRAEKYCDYADRLGITELRGLGTVDRKYALCLPEHFNLIGRNADNPNNSEDIIGYFVYERDIDFTGVTDFKGIPVMQAGEFFLRGYDNVLRNLTIDTSATNEDAAFVLGCVGSTTESTPFFQDVQFDNITVRSGSGRAAVAILDKNCDMDVTRRFILDSGISNSIIHSNNTAGFWASEYNTSFDNIWNATVDDSVIYSTRPDKSTAVGGGIGKLGGSATFATPDIRMYIRNVDIRPAQGQTDSGHNIGGLFGEIDANNIRLTSSQVVNLNVIGGLDSLGGFIGRMRGGADNLLIANGVASFITFDDTGSSLDNRGGAIGELVYVNNAETVSDLTLNNFYTVHSNIRGGNSLGGFIGHAMRPSNIRIENNSRVSNTDITGNSNLGGMIGYFFQGELIISDSHYGINQGGAINGTNTMGGFVGYLRQVNTTVTQSSVQRLTIDSIGGRNIGGVFGYSDQCTFSLSEIGVGDTHLTADSSGGGLIGANTRSNFSMNNTYTNTNVTVSGRTQIGGFFGYHLIEGDDSFELVNSVALGEVSTLSATDVGAVIGRLVDSNGSSNVNISSNYYKNDHTGPNTVNSNPAYDVVGEIEGVNASQISTQSTYVGWDYTDTWFLTPDRPKLQVYTGTGEL